MKEKLYLASPHMSDEGYEQFFVKEAFDTNWLAPLGLNVDGFEKELAEYVKSPYAAALSTGTASIHLALKAAGVEKGDIVFCQSLTFSGSCNPIMYLDATPVFIDSDEKTWNMSPNALEKAFEKYQPKAVIVVHLYGQSADIDSIKSLCDKNDAVLIEDAAESLGTKYKGQHTGTIADYGIYSFNGNKIITTSGGGMLVSKNQERMNKVRFWATQSRDQAVHYQHSELGYNYRMSNILAGMGRGQLKVLQDRVNRKREIYNTYKKELAELTGVTFMPDNEWDEPNCWLSVIQTTKVKPLEIIDALKKENIESRPVWKPMHLQPYYEKYDFVGGNIAQNLFENGVCLPSDTKMTRKQQMEVIDIIKGLWK